MLPLRLGQDPDVAPELVEGRVCVVGIFAFREEIGLHDGVEGHGVDGLSGPFGKEDPDSASELEVGEEGDVVRAFLAFGEGCEDEEALPPLSLAVESDALERAGQRI